jgi:biotin operon repressor
MNIRTTPVPNLLFDVHLKELKLAELKVLLIIIRQTLGWEDKRTNSERKEIDWISGSQLAQKTGTSKRAINQAIHNLIEKKLIEVLSQQGDLLDTADQRRGKQKLYFRLSGAIFMHVDMRGKTIEKGIIYDAANANFAQDLRKKISLLTQNMRITKETIPNQL